MRILMKRIAPSTTLLGKSFLKGTNLIHKRLTLIFALQINPNTCIFTVIYDNQMLRASQVTAGRSKRMIFF